MAFRISTAMYLPIENLQLNNDVERNQVTDDN